MMYEKSKSKIDIARNTSAMDNSQSQDFNPIETQARNHLSQSFYLAPPQRNKTTSG